MPPTTMRPKPILTLLLPDPLKLNSGRQVTNANVWWKKRRPEIVEDFDREVYGRLPKGIPPVEWEVLSETRDTVGLYHVKIKNS